MATHGEPITVAAICETGKRMKPVWFVYQGCRHRVTEVTYFWREQVGATTHHHFTVFDGQEAYEIAYNTRDASWVFRARLADRLVY